MPHAPPAFDARPVTRPSTVTVAAAIAFAQAVVTMFATLASFVFPGLGWTMVLLSFFGADQDDIGTLMLLSLVQLAGAALLVTGGVLVLVGMTRSVLIAACVVELLICAVYIGLYPQMPSAYPVLRAGLILSVVYLGAMPVSSLILVLGREARLYSRRG